jgi:hypothetical protein
MSRQLPKVGKEKYELVNTIRGAPDLILTRNACGITGMPEFHCKTLTVIGIKCLVACSWSHYNYDVIIFTH